MTVDYSGETREEPPLRPVGTPRAEATNHYAQRLDYFENLIRLGGLDEGTIPLVLEGKFIFDANLIAIIAKAARAEREDPTPLCGAPIGPRHCVKRWRHPETDPHWVQE